MTDLAIIAFAVATATFMLSMIMIGAMNAHMNQMEKQVEVLSKNLDAMKVQVQALRAQLEQLIKYSPLYNG